MKPTESARPLRGASSGMTAFCVRSARCLLREPLSTAAMNRRYTLDVAAPLLRTQSYLDGRWVSAASEFPVVDPCTGQEIVRVSNCGAGEARTAVLAAYEAFQSWKQTTAKVRSSAGLHIHIKPPGCARTRTEIMTLGVLLLQVRSQLLRRWFDLLVLHQEDLAKLITFECVSTANANAAV